MRIPEKGIPREKLFRKMEELKEMRQRAFLIRRVFGSMFRPG